MSDSQATSSSKRGKDWEARLRAIVARDDADTGTAIRDLLRICVDRLGVDVGQLARIDPADGTHTVTETVGLPNRTGHQQSLSDTYCRTVLAEGGTQSINDAPAEGWAEDAAYQGSGMACYLGTKVVVGEKLYGTVSFASRSARKEAFTEADRAAAESVAQGIGRTIERARQNEQLLEARHRLSRTQRLFQRVQTVADVGAWELDIQAWEVFWTKGAGRILGLGGGSSGLEALFGQIRPADQEEIRKEITQAIERRDDFCVEVPLKEEVGTCTWIEIRGVPHRSDKLVTTIVGTLRDITDQHRRRREIERTRRESLRRLARAAEHRHCETGRHIQRVGRISGTLAAEIGQSSAWQDRIERAAPLHDVGKIGIPDAILLKSGRLTDDEYDEMKTHTTIGADLLSGGRSNLVRMAEKIARHHHEQWNGNGYPDGIEDEDIPLEARIVAVADTIDAMTHDRPYRDAESAESAFETIAAEAGPQFDPSISEAALNRKEDLAELL
ncbi:MAG: HD domain-containing phosphohydrolase [Salinibacter sp.]